MKRLNLMGRMYREELDDSGDPGIANSDVSGDAEEGGTAPDWRTDFSGGDTDFAERLQRYATPADAGKALRSAQEKIREGVKPQASAPPEGASDDELTAWRSDNNIPTSASDYLTNLDDSVIGEEDQEMYESFAETLLEQNLPQDVMARSAQWFTEYQEMVHEERQNADAQGANETVAMLRDELGADFKPTMNIINSFIDSNLSEDAAESLRSARDQNGNPLFNNPDIIKFFNETARDIVPMADIVGDVNGAGERGQERMKEIQGWMNSKASDTRNKYWKDDSVQQEYLKLLEADERQKARDR